MIINMKGRKFKRIRQKLKKRKRHKILLSEDKRILKNKIFIHENSQSNIQTEKKGIDIPKKAFSYVHSALDENFEDLDLVGDELSENFDIYFLQNIALNETEKK